MSSAGGSQEDPRPMKSARHLTILTLLLTLAPIAAAAAPDGGPAAAVVEPVIDVGEVPVGEPVEAEFRIRNDGDQPLEISNVRPSCGCTVAEYDEVIAPGATGSVRAHVDTENIVGPNAKSITVYTNDAASPRIRLTIKSDVTQFLGLDPGYVRFTSFVQKEKDEKVSVLLGAHDFESLEITDVESPESWKGWLGVSYREALDEERDPELPGKQWRIDVTLSKDAPVGPLAENVTIHTNHPRQKTIELPVSGFIRPVVGVTPSSVDLGRVDPSEAQEWGILVRNFGSAPLEIDDFESTVSGLEVAVEPIEEGQRYKLVLKPTPAMAKGPFQGRVELHTNLPQQPSITVDLSGEIL